MKVHLLNEILKTFNEKEIDYDVYIIANAHNIKKETEKWDYAHSTLDEFFSRQEFAEISSAIYNVFGFVKVFYSELEFMDYVIKNKIDRNNLIVFNFSRDGIREGKKSLIPSFCDLFEIKYTGSNAFVISLLRNKFVYSTFLSHLNIPVPNSYLFNIRKGFINSEPNCGIKIIKCVNESASIGMTDNNIITIKNDSSYIGKIKDCMKLMSTENVLIQDYIEGSECEVVVFNRGDTYFSLDPVMLKIKNNSIITTDISNSYDYDFCLLSDHYDSDICASISACAENAARLLNIKTYARFDFRIDPNNNFFLIDIAGTPYTIHHSSIAFIFKHYKLQYEDIFRIIAQLSKEN